MPRRADPNHVPAYPAKPHASGQARIRIGGRDVYLGPWGSPESQQRYRRAVAEYLTGSPPEQRADDGCGLTIREAAALYLRHARGYYVKQGKPTSQVQRIESSLAVLIDLYGDQPAGSFSPLRLKAARQKMIDSGITRRHINHRVGCIVRCWKWLAGEEIVPASSWTALRSVDGLRAGRCAAPEGKPVLPVPESDIDATLKYLLPPVAAMVELQRWTGARSGEICQLRPCDVDRESTPGVWLFRPASWKTEHHGRGRVILIGPRGQAVLSPWLLREPEQWCFSPREALERWGGASGRRRLGMQHARPVGDRYRNTSYGHAIARACKLAGVPHWHPHRLRHSAAGKFAAEFGFDTARIILGHRHLDTTRIYAEDNIEKAAKAMREAG